MKTSEKILTYIKEHGQTAPNELIGYLGITGRAVGKQLGILLERGQLQKSGVPPRVYYSISSIPSQTDLPDATTNIDKSTKKLIEKEFLYITPRGAFLEGLDGFLQWCRERNQASSKTAEQYRQIVQKYSKYKKSGFIDGMHKIKTSFDDVALDKIFYMDFYSIEIFGKTRLGQLLLFAKQSQNRKLINELVEIIRPSVMQLIQKYAIDGVGFIPPTVKRELQFMRQLKNRLNLPVRMLDAYKIKTEVAVPQKTLTKIEDRIINARETIAIDSQAEYNNILLIDDAAGSGATLNETAKKIRHKGICKGKIIGLAITGSLKGFEIISEV